MTERTPLLVSVSGGRSSGLMARTIQIGPAYEQYEKHYVFANTGKEREATLRFVDRMAREWDMPIVWLEAVVHAAKGIGTTHKVVTFDTASRNGEPFDAVIAKFGVPNKGFPHCTRELKQRVFASYMRSLGLMPYTSAIGFRIDEPQRMSGRTEYGPSIYPLWDLRLSRQEVRLWWRKQPFDLEIEDWQGNCDLCWKKSLAKRIRTLREEPDRAEWWASHEDKSEYKFDLREKVSVRELSELAATNKLPVHVDTQLEFPCMCSE